MAEVVDIVDERGNVVGRATREEVYAKGLLHPAVNIIIVDPQGKIYIQQRSAKKSAFPLYWDISCAEHLKSGETFEAAAVRGLLEELSIGVNVEKLRGKHIQRSEYHKGDKRILEYELVELWGAVWKDKIKIDPEEVARGKYVSLADLKKFDESKFTPWGLDEVRFVLKSPQVIFELAH